MYYVISGGVGDFLQCLPHFFLDSNSHNKYMVVTHFKEAKLFFEKIGKTVETIEYYTNNEELDAILRTVSKLESVAFCPRTQYFASNPFAKRDTIFNNNLRVIGVHLNGSTYDESANEEAKLPSKNLPLLLVDVLFQYECNIAIFGAQSEIKMMQIVESEYLKVIAYSGIIDSLSEVSICDVFVGCDSAFKTMSSMLKTPTLVWLPDYDDKFRDNIFIDPYVNDGIMSIVRFSTLETSTVDVAISKTKEFLKYNRFTLKLTSP